MEGDRPQEPDLLDDSVSSAESDDQGKQDKQGNSAITTLFIAGFPSEATSRELKNLCRLFPGYEGCNVNCKGRGSGSLFVKFQTVQDANEAMSVLKNLPFDEEHPDEFLLKVSYAKRDLDMYIEPIIFSERYALPPGTAPTLRMLKEGVRGDGGRTALDFHGHHRTSKRMRDEELCDERRVRRRVGGDDRYDHGHGHDDDNDRGRRRLHRTHDRIKDSGRHRGDGHVRHLGRNSDPCYGHDDGHMRHGRDRDEHRRDGGRDRCHARSSDYGHSCKYESDLNPDHGDIDTVAVLNMRDKGISDEKVRHWSGKEPGFVTMHYNPKIDGFFIKYASPEDAEYAKEALNRRNVDAEMARRNLELRD